jgi:hypothetical protein
MQGGGKGLGDPRWQTWQNSGGPNASSGCHKPGTALTPGTDGSDTPAAIHHLPPKVRRKLPPSHPRRKPPTIVFLAVPS